ncbi:LysR family substrate-binding domain-containing protein (plasmid) [Coraliomargarita sp. W4R53]
MGKSSGNRGRAPKSGRDASHHRARKLAPWASTSSANNAPKKKKKPVDVPEAEAVVEMPTQFTLGVIPGATPGKWIDLWNTRMPRTQLNLVHLTVPDQQRALMSGEVDAAIVRLPISKDDLHVIDLYEEEPVVVAAIDSHLTAAESLSIADLAGEVVIVPADDVLALTVPESVAPTFAPPSDTTEAIQTVATGVGIIVVPMSLARAGRRKDTAYRVLRDGPVSGVGVAWLIDSTNPAIDTFIGIVRGRTVHSSRS